MSILSLVTRVAPQVALATFALSCSIVSARPSGWPQVADEDVMRDSVRVQSTRTMTLELPGSADQAFPLFGPVREGEWSPGWKPAFIVPTTAAQTLGGAVFTTDGPTGSALWVMTDYSPAQHVVRYVHVRPGQLIAQIWIEVRAMSPQASQADVTFRYTVLGPEGEAMLAHFVEKFPEFKPHWEQAVGGALTHGASHFHLHHH
jgi:hypothetical protein